MDFEWDPVKGESNFRKHGVAFADAVTALYDDLAITIPDDEEDEERFVTIGIDATQRLLVVVYCFRGERLRLISARRATRGERGQYEVNR